MLGFPPALGLGLLRLLAGVFGLASMLIVTLCTWRWRAVGWSESQTGLFMTLGWGIYPLFVAWGGRCAERWGCQRVASLAAFGAAFSAVLMLWPSGWSAALALAIFNLTAAFYFPSVAGLVAEVGSGDRIVPLPQRVSRYNVGWSGGNLVGIAVATALASGFQSLEVQGPLGVTVVVLTCLLAALTSACGRILPRTAGAIADDPVAGADHPAVPTLRLAARLALGFTCIGNAALISLLLAALTQVGNAPLAEVPGRLLQSCGLLASAVGTVAGFAWLGMWHGWTMRPGRLLLVKLLLPGCALGVVVLPHQGPVEVTSLMLACLLIGVGYAATYTASIYYSLLTRAGAARSAGVHETFIGAGNLLGPVLGGLLLAPLAGWWAASQAGGLVGLGWFCLLAWSLALLVEGLLLYHLPTRCSATA